MFSDQTEAMLDQRGPGPGPVLTLAIYLHRFASKPSTLPSHSVPCVLGLCVLVSVYKLYSTDHHVLY